MSPRQLQDVYDTCVKQLFTSLAIIQDVVGTPHDLQRPSVNRYFAPQKTHMPLRSSRGMPNLYSSSLRSRFGVFFFPCAILTFSKYTYLRGSR